MRLSRNELRGILLSTGLITVTYTGDPQSWECYIRRNPTTMDRKEQEQGIWYKVVGLPKFYRQATRIYSYSAANIGLLLRKWKNDWGRDRWIIRPKRWRHMSRQWSYQSQMIMLRLQNLIEFVLLDLKLAWDWWPLYYLEFLPFGMGLSILC